LCVWGQTLSEDLKVKLGFSGWVMSDWGATHSTVQAALAGLDQEVRGDSVVSNLPITHQPSHAHACGTR
jgi:beta-glucosidase